MISKPIRCNVCGAPIRMIRSLEKRKTYAVDPEPIMVAPDLRGRIKFYTAEGDMFLGVEILPGEPDAVAGYTPHKFTCGGRK